MFSSKQSADFFKQCKYVLGAADNPYLDLFSGSTEQVHRKFFAFSDLKDKPIDGKFDSYGLSKVATIPWF